MLTQVNAGLKKDVGCLSGLNATCHPGPNQAKSTQNPAPQINTANRQRLATEATSH